jgi:uncharacterized protein YigE (DUF2233 family)
MVHGLPLIKTPSTVCEECYAAKQTRNSFKNELLMRSTQKLEMVCSDVCGSFELKSIGGNNYFLTFIDDYTRHVWLYLIEKKSEVFTKFKKFKALVEKQNSLEFAKFCEDEGIVHEVTAPCNCLILALEISIARFLPTKFHNCQFQPLKF